MDQSQDLPFLETERQNTDNSLNAERDKTNESITQVREETERHTDDVVQAERFRADHITISSRVQTDADRENKKDLLGSDSKSSHYSQHLHDERRSADRRIEQERSRVDAALDQERDLRNASISRLLAQEREQTDENLSVERTHTDSRVHQVSKRLSTEIAEHLKTKTSLTTRDEFLAIVSHDLRNPIGAASSCAEMLLEDAAYKELSSDVRNWLGFIKRNVDASLRLISDLLDMERVAEGKLQLTLGRHDIGRIIRDTIERYALIASAKNILLRAMPSDISGEVSCDRDRITQVISNLIGNAVKFTSEGGSVTVNANIQESEVQVSVRDTGPGIPADKMDHIFERFVQLNSADRRGLGLGLHISKMLVEAHSGRLWVQSEIGYGSTFFFAIPRENSPLP